VRFRGDGTVESTVGVTSVGLRLCSNTDAVPSCEEVVWACDGLVSWPSGSVV
jgi:hypothetical protein